MPALRRKSVELTAYFEGLIDALVPGREILTPRDPAARGAQLSLRVCRRDTRGWLRWRPPASSPTSASRTSSAWRRSRCTTRYHDAWRAARALAETQPDLARWASAQAAGSASPSCRRHR